MFRRSVFGALNINFSQRISTFHSLTSDVFSKHCKNSCNKHFNIDRRSFRSSLPVLKKDFYKLLGVTKFATRDEIKRNYRELAKKYHPDLNRTDPTAEAKFKEVSEAHEILENEQKRKLYDSYGHDGVDPSFQEYDSPGGDSGDFEGVEYVDLEEMFNMNSKGGKSGKKKGRNGRRNNSNPYGIDDMDIIQQLMMDMQMNNINGGSRKGKKSGKRGGRDNIFFEDDDFFVEFNMGGFDPFGGFHGGGGGGGGKSSTKPSSKKKKPPAGGGGAKPNGGGGGKSNGGGGKR